MMNTTNIRDQTSIADQSLEEIEDVLKAHGQEEQYHIFRSFLLLHPTGTVSDWKHFSSQTLFSAFSHVLDILPVSTITILCRRHFSEFPYFLNYFDRSPIIQMQPKSYLPYLCHRIDYIPVQWIVTHLFKISNLRYAYQFITSAFKDGIIINSNQYERILEKNEIWKSYLKISDQQNNLTISSSWAQLNAYRTLMKQLLDFKLAISLSDFRNFDKTEFIRNQLFNCISPTKYIRLLETSILGFAKVNSIDLTPIIIRTLSHRNWPINEKLKILEKYVCDHDQLEKAISIMSFNNDDELQIIRQFADRLNLIFDVLPDNYIEAINSQSNQRIDLKTSGRSSSIEFISTPNDAVLLQPSLSCYKSSANLLSQKSEMTISRSLSELANGYPTEPDLYLKKLQSYFKLKEIAPIVALAKFGLVVTYDQFSDREYRKEILKILIKKHGYENLQLFFEVLLFSDDDIINFMCTENMIEGGEFFASSLVQYVNRINSETFYKFIEKVSKYTAKNSDPCKACTLWLNLVHQIFDSLDSETIESVCNRVLCLTALMNTKATIQQKRQLFDIHDNIEFSKKLKEFEFGEFSEISDPQLNQNFSIQSFLGGYSSNELVSISTQLYRLKKLPKEKLIEFCVASIPQIKGNQYSRILLLYNLLKQNNMNYSTDIAVLKIIYYSPKHNIDFHQLMKTPLDSLIKETNESNIFELLPLEKIFKIKGDKLLLDFMINKMTSSSFEKYKQYIAHLDHRSSLEIILNKLPSRFNVNEKILFYQGVGCTDIMKKEQVQNELIMYGLKEYIKPEFINSPSKLICELYSKLALHERLGDSLHKLCKSIASKNDLNLNRLCEHLLETWLNEDIRNIETDKTSDENPNSIYTQTIEEICQKDDETNIQKCLFLLHTWNPRDAAKWLIRFIFQSDSNISYRARLKAVHTLFVVADRKLISDVFKSGNFDDIVQLNMKLYYASRLELFNIHYELNDFDQMKVMTTIKKSMNLPEGALRSIFELCIDYKINDKSILISLISKLIETRKRFLLRIFNKFFSVFPKYKYDEDFKNLYIIVISAPVNDMICQTVKSRLKSHHLEVIRDLFDSIAAETIFVDHMIIDHQKVSFADAIEQICSSGMTQFAADLGAHLVGNKTRNEALLRLLKFDKYDDAISSGFDKDLVFEYIVKNDSIANATNMLVDENFVLFTAWLKKHRYEDAIEKVKEALRKQGRTKEIQRMEARLAKQTT